MRPRRDKPSGRLSQQIPGLSPRRLSSSKKSSSPSESVFSFPLQSLPAELILGVIGEMMMMMMKVTFKSLSAGQFRNVSFPLTSCRTFHAREGMNVAYFLLFGRSEGGSKK